MRPVTRIERMRREWCSLDQRSSSRLEHNYINVGKTKKVNDLGSVDDTVTCMARADVSFIATGGTSAV